MVLLCVLNSYTSKQKIFHKIFIMRLIVILDSYIFIITVLVKFYGESSP